MSYPERGDKGAVQDTLLEPPVGGILRELRREMDLRRRRYEPERGEILGQPLASRLDERLLQRPQPEKASRPLRCGQGGKPGDLLRREIAIGHFEVDVAGEVFEI